MATRLPPQGHMWPFGGSDQAPRACSNLAVLVQIPGLAQPLAHGSTGEKLMDLSRVPQKSLFAPAATHPACLAPNKCAQKTTGFSLLPVHTVTDLSASQGPMPASQ